MTHKEIPAKYHPANVHRWISRNRGMADMAVYASDYDNIYVMLDSLMIENKRLASDLAALTVAK